MEHQNKVVDNTNYRGYYFHITLYIVPLRTISVEIASVGRSGRHVHWKP